MARMFCSAVLFDLDGVLVESRASVEKQWTRWAQEKGLDPAGVLSVAHGRPTIDIVREFFPQGDLYSELKIVEQREIEDCDLVRVIPGAAELLAKIPPARWTVVTSGTRALAESRLKHVGLPIPSKMITASDITQGKPHPEPYLKAASALGFRPNDCVVVEDAPPGVQAGRAAGMKVLGVLTTHAREEVAEADYVVERLADVDVAIDGAGLIEISVPVERVISNKY